MWRPEDWQTKHLPNEHWVYEAGADAMLIAVRKITTEPRQWIEFYRMLQEDKHEKETTPS